MSVNVCIVYIDIVCVGDERSEVNNRGKKVRKKQIVETYITTRVCN